jgi:hypothetical protein
MSLDQFRSVVPRLVRCQDGELVTPQDVDRVLQVALRQYSADAPRTLVRDIAWGAAAHLADAPENMSADSKILQAEYPIGSAPPELIFLSLAILPPADLAVMSDTPVGVGDTVRVTFTAAHVLSSTEDSVPGAHADALGYFAASLLCRELAAHYSGERESSIGADASQTESRARNYAQRAKDYRAAYFAGLGLRDPMLASGGAGAGSGGSASVGQGAGAVTTWPKRSRHSLTRLVG